MAENNFVQDAEVISVSSGPLPVPVLLPEVPDGYQVVDVAKLRQLLEVTRQIKIDSEEKKTDINNLMNGFVDMMEEMGMAEMIATGKKPSPLKLSGKLMKLIPGLLNGTNTKMINAGKTFSEFLK